MNFENLKDNSEHEKLVKAFYEKFSKLILPPEYAYFVKENLLQFTIRLARYKFVFKMINKKDNLLEIGCGSGLGTLFLAQKCNFVTGIDINHRWIQEAMALNCRDNIKFLRSDFINLPISPKYDVIVALDVIEHMDEADGHRLIEKTLELIRPDGMLIVGTPSIYSYEYQNEFSKADHKKLYDFDELMRKVESFYGRVIGFSMNDELVHTGFHKLAWYYFILAFCPKK